MAVSPKSPPWVGSLVGWCLVRKLVCGAVQVCPRRENSGFSHFCEFLRNMRKCRLGENAENFDKYLYHAPWKCVMSHLPCRAAVFDGEPNFSHKNPPYLPEPNPCDFCLFLGVKNGVKFRRFASLKEIQYQATAGPTAITNRSCRVSATNWSTAVASVRACARARACVCADEVY